MLKHLHHGLLALAVVLATFAFNSCHATTHEAASHRMSVPGDPQWRTTTSVRCYYRAGNDPFNFDDRYVWAIDPDTNGDYRLPGEWHGGQTYHWQALFYTAAPARELKAECERSLQRSGITGQLVGWAAGNSALSFDYAPWSAGAGTSGSAIDRVVAFGDSLSDTHNLYNASRRRIPDSTSWFDGRFTNGPNWAEYLAHRLNVPLYDWAVGGTGVFDRRVLPWARIPGLVSQVRQWRRATADDASYDLGRTLFTVLDGGNDLIYFDTPVDEILANERRAIEMLIEGGAKNILVLNLPDVSRAPIFKLRPGADEVAARVTRVNRGLVAMIASLRQQYHGHLNIQLFDTNAFFTGVFDDPHAYGFSNSTESCLQIDRTGMSVFLLSHRPRTDCRDPNSFVFWDILHPTTQTHRILADRVSAFVRAHFSAALSAQS